MAEDPEWEYVEPPPEVEFAMNTAESATGVVQENYAKDAERAKFTRRQSSMCGETRSSSSGLRPTSGLLASPSGPENGEDVTDDLVSFSEPIKKPATVGEASKSESSQSISNLSLSNIRTELKNWRKSGLFNSIAAGDPLYNQPKPEADERSLSPINEGNGNQKPVKLREPKASSRGRTFWGTQSVSVDQQNIKETCQDCEEFKQILSSLKEAIQIAEKRTFWGHNQFPWIRQTLKKHVQDCEE
eukprot:gene8141-14063_t